MKSLMTCFLALVLILFISTSIEFKEPDFLKGFDAISSNDYQRAFNEFYPLAKQGELAAQLGLAFMYENGHGVNKNYNKAMELYLQVGTRYLPRYLESPIKNKVSFETLSEKRAILRNEKIAIKESLRLGTFVKPKLTTLQESEKLSEKLDLSVDSVNPMWEMMAIAKNNNEAIFDTETKLGYLGDMILRFIKFFTDFIDKDIVKYSYINKYKLYSNLNFFGGNNCDLYCGLKKSKVEMSENARYHLALMYLYGRGVKQNYKMAYIWLNTVQDYRWFNSASYDMRLISKLISSKEFYKVKKAAKQCIESNYKVCS